MDIKLRITFFIAILIYFIYIFIMLKKKNLNLKYTLLWILSGIAMAVIVIIPEQFITIIEKMGIKDSNIGVLTIVLFFGLILLMSLTSIVSKLNDKIRNLVQQIGILEKRTRQIETLQNKRDN